ncbi:MAG: T9SS type A sorting domain-containing protein, partial [Muribaculaceae bacterium]|nr:T9SS type A sorting domain-containing protein [Muribaculaceae bacterium]
YTGIESPLYYAGQELDFTVKFGLPGYKGDWTDHGCYVAQAFVNGTECDITSTTVSNSISEEGYEGERYARTQEVAFKATMPEAPITLSYATSESHEQAEDVSEAVKAINNATIEYNNWGVGEAPKTPYFIDETTLKPTDKIYYAVTFYDDRDNMLQVPSPQVSEQAKVYTYQDTEYTLYPAGGEVTIDTYPIGYSADWSSKGYYLNTVYSMSNSAELPIAASNVNDDLQNITDGNYHRTHTATVKLPETSNGPITLYCSVAETAPENAVFNDITEDVTNINNATIIYNNWGVGEEPATPYYIEQDGNSFVKSDKIYYAFEPAIMNPEGNRETTGVRSEAEYVHTENKKTFTYNETEYPLYANGDVVGIKCYLDGFTMEMEDNNEGWKVAQVNENNANAWEISEDSEYAEIIADITNEEGFDNETERFCREHTVFVTVPLVTEMRRQPISLTYTTAGKIKDDTATSIEDITGDATYAHGVITSDGIIEVYNINGILVARKKNQVNMAELNSGIYLVRCGNKTMKIVR